MAIAASKFSQLFQSTNSVDDSNEEDEEIKEDGISKILSAESFSDGEDYDFNDDGIDFTNSVCQEETKLSKAVKVSFEEKETCKENTILSHRKQTVCDLNDQPLLWEKDWNARASSIPKE